MDVHLALQLVAGALYAVALIGLLLYGLNAYVMLALHCWRRHAQTTAAPAEPDQWPTVTVQLPLYNERYVARRLLDAVRALDYPAERLEIQVLDDSTDETSAIIAETARELGDRGLTIHHLRRADRTGFKAGALAAGLRESRSEFIAIFDADFVPPRDFLRRTIPHFADSKVAVVQSRWGHLNRDFSLLTLAQSLGIDGHFAVEQPARCWNNLLLNFNGTAGVWRRTAIEDAGGWAHDTLTEDLDLSYRAQLRGWQIVYRPELVCPAELPVMVSGFKSQQRRWAKGSIQTALKLLPAVFRSRLSAWAKYQAFIHLTYYMIHPLMLAVVLLSVPLLDLSALAPSAALLVLVSSVFALASLGPACMLAYAQSVVADGGWRNVVKLPSIMVIGVGVAWSTSLAVLSAFWSRDHTFIRTPKFGIGAAGGHWKGRDYTGGPVGSGLPELALGIYCGWTVWLFLSHGQYGVLPFLLLYTAGFLTVGALTILHALPGRSRTALGLIVAASALLCAGTVAGEDRGSASLEAEGRRWWSESPDPRNPVACATCHDDPAVTRGWAASFPKLKPLPPPHARVMTLLQANAEAVSRHYRLPDPVPAATAITVYLVALGRDMSISPGISADQPVFPARIQALVQSVERGARVFADRCRNCHRAAAVAPAVRAFPRADGGRAESLESFLSMHRSRGRQLRWNSQAMADLAAYLVSQLAGRPLGVEKEAS
jgi:cellulose synthase/poly-beta-1,6-N-acetylglucosamine synthase-like glycosyltransferase/cytochrome c553